eukprot:gnl/MRDRNA2_/MRDRNA2_85354_c0_seq2.p1 gnl/MRDRNA2_/MRDRNA2_85354_c0~~gnl/MRDRNA2_/MRDRNA2_85354_c0_seq2.p1  ORF type:complete len:114 (+),score=11.25 gnl/MRDRNA2_/MRDRNA2_85354_c0_seq2:124-465(+)
MYAKVLVFWSFAILGTAMTLLQHGAREVHYNFLCPTILTALAKLVISLILYMVHDGKLREIPEQLKSAKKIVLRYSAVAGLFCIYDVLSFVNLGHFDRKLTRCCCSCALCSLQ